MRKKSKVATILNFIFGLITVGVAATSAVVVYRAVKNTSGTVESDALIEIESDTVKTLKAELTGFYPGSVQEYTIALTNVLSDDYEVTLSFRDEDESATLKHFLNVTISAQDVRIEKSLDELFSGGAVSLGSNVSEITITYAMPEAVGNEAQGATADFCIDFSAKSVRGDDEE